MSGLKRVGATPALIREAWGYSVKGLGVHYIHSDNYDNVEVSEVYPWKTLGDNAQGCIRVSFRRGENTLRFIEFSAYLSGAGGEPVVRVVPTWAV